MRYDYDIFAIIPDEVQSQFQGMFNDLGVSAMMGAQKGLWRDPDVVAALHGADPVVKDLFLNAGFGINHYHSGAPEGRFLKRDQPARVQCETRFMDALAKGLQDGSLKGANWNGFDVRAFLMHLEAATPIDEVEVEQMRAAAMAQHKAQMAKRRMALYGLVAGFAIIVVVGVMMISQTTVIAGL